MDKSLPPPPSSSENNSTSVSTTRDQYLKHLNKLSHKISKPTIITRKPNFDPLPPPPPPPPLPPPPTTQTPPPPQPNQHQPPVYNINKNDFRDVVQKLTGSPAHHENRFATPPPIHPPKTQSSRLQRIRPPPLAQLTAARPPNLLDNNGNNQNQVVIPPPAAHFGRGSAAPLSPLPPFPTVHAAAESPVSAYMRFLHNSLSTGGGGGDSNLNQKQQQQQQNQQYHFSGFSPLAPLVSPRWTNLSPPPPQNQNQNQQMAQPEQNLAPPSSSEPPQFTMPPSPLPFGCLNSPRSQYGGLISPNQLGFPQLPLSPTVPVPSPRWKGY